MGSFGVNSDIEPRVSGLECEKMQEILPLLGSDSAAAIEALEQLAGGRVGQRRLRLHAGQRLLPGGPARPGGAALPRRAGQVSQFRRAHKNLGLIHVRRGDCSEAVGPLSRVIELGGDEALTYGLLGYAYVELEQYIAAESAYRRAMLLQPERAARGSWA